MWLMKMLFCLHVLKFTYFDYPPFYAPSLPAALYRFPYIVTVYLNIFVILFSATTYRST